MSYVVVWVSAWKDDPDRIAWFRAKLGNLSYFMRALNQFIAKAANAEDNCTGKFWEGRFKCQRLEDESAVLSVMTYVDLNPIRAKLAADLPSSDHTSVKRRIERIAGSPREAKSRLGPVVGTSQTPLLEISELAYVELVDWTGRLLHPQKRGKIAAGAPPILRQMGISERRWRGQVRGTETIYWHAVGSFDALCERADALGQQWLRGMRSVRALEPPR